MDDISKLRRLAGILNENVFDPAVQPVLDEEPPIDEMMMDEAPVILDEVEFSAPTSDPVLRGFEATVRDHLERIEEHLKLRAEHEAQELSRSFPDSTVTVTCSGVPAMISVDVDGDTSHTIPVASEIGRLDHVLHGEVTPEFAFSFKAGKLITKA